ncbi:MAG: Lrp/AsnC family transcriptional regulator [Bacillota bacterium]
MTLDIEKTLDNTGWQILRALQENARLSFAELGRMVGLSPPAVAERVRRMEEAGIITGYHAAVNLEKLGLQLTAYIRLNAAPEKYPRIIALAGELPEVLECHHVTGGEAFIMKVVVSSIPHLEARISRFSPYGQTTTSLVLSSRVVKHVVAQGPLDGSQ